MKKYIDPEINIELFKTEIIRAADGTLQTVYGDVPALQSMEVSSDQTLMDLLLANQDDASAVFRFR